jgi:hypothetical protein
MRASANRHGFSWRRHKRLNVAVFVLDKRQQPLMPCTPKREENRIACCRTRIRRLFLFCIRFVERPHETNVWSPLHLLFDSCRKTTGLALCRIDAAVDISGAAEPSSSCSSW